VDTAAAGIWAKNGPARENLSLALLSRLTTHAVNHGSLEFLVKLDR
jgi:hypothetical protein